jgi:hypothetical protein
MAQSNGDFFVKDCQVVMKYLFLKGNSVKNNYNGMLIMLDDKYPTYSTVKNWLLGLALKTNVLGDQLKWQFQRSWSHSLNDPGR